MFFLDPLYLIIMAPAIILTIIAQIRVKYTFNKYSRVPVGSGISGAEASKRLLESNGVLDVLVEKTGGKLTDYYDPRNKVLYLSQPVYEGRTLASVGVAAHETGHALQDKNKYIPMKLRSGLVPFANFGSSFAMPLFFVGILVVGWLRSSVGFLLMNAAIILFTAAVVFQLITLPVEYNASRRGMSMLEQSGIITENEYHPAKSVLNAAALTYVAAAASAILTLLYLILRSQSRD